MFSAIGFCTYTQPTFVISQFNFSYCGPVMIEVVVIGAAAHRNALRVSLTIFVTKIDLEVSICDFSEYRSHV
jgi:hypothetical protein